MPLICTYVVSETIILTAAVIVLHVPIEPGIVQVFLSKPNHACLCTILPTRAIGVVVVVAVATVVVVVVVVVAVEE